MESHRFSTRDLARPRQLEAWRDWYANSYEVAAIDEDDNGFAAESEVWRLDGVGLAKITAPAIRASRTKLLTRRDPVDHVCITMGRQALTGFMIGSDWREVPAGVPFVFALDDVHVSQRAADERLQLYIARDRFHEHMPALDAARGLALQTPLRGLLSDYLRLLIQTLPGLTVEDAQRLPSAIVAMISACVAPSADGIAMAQDSLDATRKEKIRRFILRNLCSPRLGPDMLSRELGISRSNLYRLFEPEGGVANYIRLHRLRESYSQLSDPHNSRPVWEIAESLGLVDRSSFSRAFRTAFGATPMEVREAARTGMSAALAASHSDHGTSESFRSFLREL